MVPRRPRGSPPSANNGLVFVYDTATWRELSRFGQGFHTHDLAYDPTGGRLAVTSTVQDEVRVVDANDGTVHWSYRHRWDVQAVAWHPDGRRLATACNDNLVRILDVTQKDRPLRLTIAGHLSSVVDVAFHPDGEPAGELRLGRHGPGLGREHGKGRRERAGRHGQQDSASARTAAGWLPR